MTYKVDFTIEATDDEGNSHSMVDIIYTDQDLEEIVPKLEAQMLTKIPGNAYITKMDLKIEAYDK